MLEGAHPKDAAVMIEDSISKKKRVFRGRGGEEYDCVLIS